MLADQAFCALRRSGAESRDDLEMVLEGAFGAFPVIAHQPSNRSPRKKRQSFAAGGKTFSPLNADPGSRFRAG